MTVSQSDLGSMLLATVRYTLRGNGFTAEYTDKLVRRHFAACDDYDKRQILTEIEVALAVPRPEIGTNRDAWEALVEEIRPPKAPYTVDYRCGKCKADGLKLWRGVHGCNDADGNGLLCAACLVPKTRIGDDGKATCDDFGMRTDQIAGWLPAVPTGDTFWGYSSVPTADVRWWTALPTYATATEKGSVTDGE